MSQASVALIASRPTILGYGTRCSGGRHVRAKLLAAFHRLADGMLILRDQVALLVEFAVALLADVMSRLPVASDAGTTFLSHRQGLFAIVELALVSWSSRR